MSPTVPRDPYEILGVGRDADERTIKKAFRVLARELHPDVNAHDSEAETKFKEAAQAYEILSNPETRATFDRYGYEGLRGSAGGAGGFGFDSADLGDIFSAFFGGGVFGGAGGGRSGPMQGRDAGTSVTVTLEQAGLGVRVTVAPELVQICEHCHGNGAEPGTPITSCERCAGQGTVRAVTRSPFGQIVREMPCDACGGDGRVAQTPCDECAGNGRILDRVTLEVDVPAGIEDGQRIRISGRGHAGERGGPSGDLYVQIAVAPDPRFVRDGEDLITVVDVSAPHASLGTQLAVDTLLGGSHELQIPAGTQAGEEIRLRGEGMPLLRGRRKGDLRVVVNVVVPRKLNAEQRQLTQLLADSITDSNLSSGESLGGKLRRIFGGR